ncbi:MAG: pyridoxamine kinase [Anaeroplasmataceae bacterium]|nr:pyridoxamine kinase [Anaeroplasmataceae bacterium]
MKKILTIQDISCMGQCSLTVALPIISAFGIETAVIPTAVLSTHTAFNGFTFHDLTEELPQIQEHWEHEQIRFDGFYTGYIGSIQQIQYIKNMMNRLANPKAVKVVDPCMADHGKLYAGFSNDFPKYMLELCKEADVIVPNLTELCLLLDVPYQEYKKEELEELVKKMSDKIEASVVLTGVSFEADKLGSLTYNRDKNELTYFFTRRVPVFFHGTGDCFASAFFGAVMKGYDYAKASEIACWFTYLAIANTESDAKEHWYGVHFEKALGYITNLEAK